ncbi:MAG: acetate/propionate family kinase [Oscillospiraceae bacterium]
MKILVINCGSSSLKYQLIDMDGEQVLCRGLCDRIGIDGSTISHKAKGEEFKKDVALPDHAEAFTQMLAMMTEGEGAVVASKDEISAVGHRVVHGGEKFSTSAIVTDDIIKAIEEVSPLAPLHNPPNLQGIRSAQQVFGKSVPQVAVFDTAFHQTMPAKAYMYALPYEFYEKYAIRRYGFHGTSHRYVSAKAAEFMGKKLEDVKIVTCHLGNGSSIAAVDCGKSVDTSMGLTPVAGLIMGTRCGDVDPGVICYMNDLTGKSGSEMSDLLNKKSGFLGVSGLSSDKRDVEAAAKDGNKRAQLVDEMLIYQIKKFVGAYAAAMNGVDCVVFTGGIGENGAGVRAAVCGDMEYMGLSIDKEKNDRRGEDFDFATADSKVRALVIQTDEELMIARDTLELVAK